MYQMLFLRPAEWALRGLPVGIQCRVDPAILALGNHPRPSGCVKLSGNESLWRSRVGAYRIACIVEKPGAGS